ncbi:Metallo-dependent phosphatase-like protein [Cokeromyces recurvatus]|uniref:Metallo-dependent phosphatase-like protein n=1 Tax=Cokeromyces recurvatus TaxID=90255 RepID=UPI00221EE971|nr:Metallo-dependent phosphatase-like protein [Cokeromyces recurvatus]KAI7904886.1 Metallo-dependent phosphatase-like protein [Cokeromyces recurvatus]
MIKSTKVIVYLLRLIWIAFIIKNEYFLFWSSARNCTLSTTQPNVGRFMLVGDPQMTDDMSYQRHPVIMFFTKYYSQLYMKRNYKHLTKALKPTDIFMLGDLMDNGREWNDKVYAKEVNRFQKIFPSDNMMIHYMVGNHDIGFGNGIKEHSLDRFKSYFGSTSYTFNKFGYTFVILDTVSLNSDIPSIQSDAFNLLSTLSNTTKTLPRILLTHVPLYRSPHQSCGPHRQNPVNTIREGAGYQYQNLLTESLSNYILTSVQPIIVFSGDDHDYCKVIHQYEEQVTVPTFSMSQGLPYPGVVIVDITDRGELITHLCWLPNQINIFINYLYMSILTLLGLFLWHIFQPLLINTNLIINTFYHQTSSTTTETPLLPLYTNTTITNNNNNQRIMSTMKYNLLSFFYSIQSVAWIGFMLYLICILFL